MTFTWDEEKNRTNKIKHHLSFELASKVFHDPNRVEIYDRNHSSSEDRFITIGYIYDVPALVVFTIPVPDEYRIISARKALKAEVEKYYYQYGKD